MKAKCLTCLSWPLISTGTSILQFFFYDVKNPAFYSTIFLSSSEAQECKHFFCLLSWGNKWHLQKWSLRFGMVTSFRKTTRITKYSVSNLPTLAPPMFHTYFIRCSIRSNSWTHILGTFWSISTVCTSVRLLQWENSRHFNTHIGIRIFSVLLFGFSSWWFIHKLVSCGSASLSLAF